ncbi:MAG: LacI family DNA-binding transcriptional regulator [Cyclonatronaceae bacterium]
MKKRATLNDIAKRMNLTKVSISKALRDHPDISESTRIKVREIAEEIGYRPNLIARSLTSSRTSTLGVVVPKIAHNFFAHVVAGIQKYANTRGYEIVLTVSEEDAELEKKHIEALVSMQVDGLLVSASMQTKQTDVYKWVKDLQIPLVFFDRYIPGLGFNSVAIDDREAARDGVDELIKKEYKRIAHIGGFDHVSIGQQRRLGYEDALKKHGIYPDPQLIVQGGFGETAGYNGFRELIDRKVEMDALFAVTFPVALGAYVAMREIDSTLIDKITVLAFGDSGIRGIVPYPQYYVDQPGMEIGQKATELLLKEIDGEIKPMDHLEHVPTRFLKTGWDLAFRDF